MRFLRQSLTGLFLLALTLGLLAWAAQAVRTAVQLAMAEPERGGPSRERMFAANVVLVTPQTITPELTAFGEVRSRRLLELRAPAGGNVIELAEGFEDGAEVRAGQMLLRIDPADATARRDLAASDLAATLAEQREAASAILLARDELTAATAQAALREQALDRQRNLLTRGAGTEAAVQEAELTLSASGQSVLSARSRLAQAEARLDQAGTALARRRIELAEAERALADTELRAEFGGTLAGVSVVAGGIVSAGEKLGQIVDPEALEVSFRLSNNQYVRLLDEAGALVPAQIRIGLEVQGAGIATTGTLSRVGAAVGEGQTGRLIYARLDQARGFRPGDFVTVWIVEPPIADVALLPAAAVGADSQVLVLGEGDRLELAGVEVLRRQGDAVIVRAAALAGREVVAERTPLLGAGIRIEPQRPGAATADAAASAKSKMVTLTAERRAELVAFVEASDRMPAEAKARALAALKLDMVPADVIARLESRMGG